MTREQIIGILRENTHKRVLVTFDDGVIQSVSVISIDDEGFVHSGPPGDAEMYWSRFQGLKFIEPDNSN